MATLVGILGSIAAGGALLAAGVWHLRHHTALRVALDGHRLWSRKATGAVARTVAGMEFAVGLAIGAGIVFGLESALVVASLAAAALFAAYTAYSAWLWRFRPTASCGCDSSGEPATAATVARAAILSITALGAAAYAGSAGDPLEAHELVTAIVAGAAWGTIVWSLPSALAVPGHRAERAAS